VRDETLTPAQLWKVLNDCLPLSTRRLCVGYSGGIDSQVLLHALISAYQKYALHSHTPFTIQAIHVHHGLNEQANAWMSHCQSFCTEWSVPLVTCHANPKDFPEYSPEAAAREARYLAFKSQLHENDVLVLGHHLDDQLETLLQRLCRGTGVLGLAGMAVYQPDKWPFGIVRPLLGLNIDRADIEAYALASGLRWVEDDSNKNERFDRNFVRHQIMPLLKSRWPKAALAAQRSAQLCREAVDFCQQQALQDKALVQYVPAVVTGSKSSCSTTKKSQAMEAELSKMAVGESLSVKRLLTFPSDRRRDILRVWLQEKGFYSPSFAHLGRIEREVLGATKGGRPRLKIRDYVVGRWRDRLFIYRAVGPLI
jgi:tRNA(Ile)-lysidine synthase